MRKLIPIAFVLLLSTPSFAQSSRPNYEQMMECSYMVGYHATQLIWSTGGRSVGTRGEYLKKISDRSSAIVRAKTPSSKWIGYVENSIKKWDSLNPIEKESRINFCVPYLESIN
jgi:hypothetical protein